MGNLSQSNKPPRPTQPGHPSVGRRNEGGDGLRLGVKADMVLFDPYLSALEAFA